MSGCITPSISTGQVLRATPCVQGDTILGTPPGKTILFSPETIPGTVFSPTFVISPGDAVLLDAYNLPVDQPIYVNRVVVSSTRAMQGEACDPCAVPFVYGRTGKIVYRERMTLGGAKRWALCKHSKPDCQTQDVMQLLITIPGTYELELSDTSMLGDMEVEYQAWKMGLTVGMPKEYFAGIVDPICEG